MEAFRIDVDHVASPQDGRQKAGRHFFPMGSLSLEEAKLLLLTNGVRFRLFDDDMDLYYEGVLTPGAEEAAFDWGMAYAGTTSLWLYEKGRWTCCIG